MSTHLEKALLHIRLASCSPKIEHFDEEYEQIIPRLWEQLKDANLFAEHEGGGPKRLSYNHGDAGTENMHERTHHAGSQGIGA